jgi:hypothetical protein
VILGIRPKGKPCVRLLISKGYERERLCLSKKEANADVLYGWMTREKTSSLMCSKGLKDGLWMIEEEKSVYVRKGGCKNLEKSSGFRGAGTANPGEGEVDLPAERTDVRSLVL